LRGGVEGGEMAEKENQSKPFDQTDVSN